VSRRGFPSIKLVALVSGKQVVDFPYYLSGIQFSHSSEVLIFMYQIMQRDHSVNSNMCI